MVEFKAALINETEKLYKKKKVLVAVILSVITIVIGQLAVIALRSNLGLRGTSSMEFPILVLSVAVYSVLPLFTALVTIDSFCGEFSHNTMKIAITRPISRLKFFTAKLAAITIFIFSNLLLIMVFSIITGALFNANSLTLGGIIKIIVSYAVTLIPMIIFALVIILLANIFKSGAGVFFLSILVFLIFKALGILFMRYSNLLFTSMFDWYNLWIMDTIPASKILREFMMMLSYGIILFTTSFYLFDKKDF